MAFILGVITLAIYLRTRSLPMITVLGIYEFTAFGSIVVSKYFASQDKILEYVVFFGIATAVTMVILRLVKE